MVTYLGPTEWERQVDALEARGAALAGVLSRAAAELVALLQEAIEGRLWQGWGFRSVEHWAAVRFGLSHRRATRLAAAARVLAELPECSAAFEAGEISEDHVAEIARAEVTAIHDRQAADLARTATVTQLRKGLSFLPRPEPEPQDETDSETPSERPAPAGLWFGFGDAGTWGLHARGLDPVAGATAERALRAARDSLFRDRHGTDPDSDAVLDDITWADAFNRMAEAALSQLDPQTEAGRPPSERYLVNLHLDAEHPERARIHLGPALPAALRSMLLCDAQVRAWITDSLGNVGLGRRQHVVDPRLRTVIEARDGGCLVPGCPVTRNLEIHHLWHWEDGGPTETWNLGAFCRGTDGHHRQLHDGRLVVTGNPDLPGTLRFTDARGRPIGRRPPPPSATDPPPAGRWSNRSGEPASWNDMVWKDPPPNRAA